MKKINKGLYKDLEAARIKNEYRLSTIKGIKNLSRSDLDTVELYAQTFERTGRYDGLMQPRGNVKELLDRYGFAPASEDLDVYS